MKRNFSLIFFIGAFMVLWAAEEEGAAAPRVAKSSCVPCHADLKSVLSKDHPVFKGGNLASCYNCHAPDFFGKAQPNPFSARIHRTHGGIKSKTDCFTCHTWVPKKSFGLFRQKDSWGAPSKGDLALLKKMVNSWASSAYLDFLHGKKNITCAGCHGQQLPKEDDTVDNARCLGYHGRVEELAERTAYPDFPKRNPHKSHLGEVNCTVCHKAHSQSKVSCLGCHTQFQMKIPGGPPPSQGETK